jgi:hypothetical protein
MKKLSFKKLKFKKITETTSREGVRDLLDSAVLHSVIGLDPSAAVISQEKQGQKQFIASLQMPTRLSDRQLGNTTAIDVYEKLGFTFIAGSKGEALKHTKGDHLFIDVILPEGWKKQATDHDMWSMVYDQHGRKRLSVFYKAASYDRRAEVSVERRFSHGYDNVYPEGTDWRDHSYDQRKKLPIYGFIKDGENIIFKTVEIEPATEENSYKVQRDMEAIAINWLQSNFPYWQDPFAYWDEPQKS